MGGECCLLLCIDAIGLLEPCQMQLKGLALMSNMVISFYLSVSLEEIYSLHLGELSLRFLLTCLFLPRVSLALTSIPSRLLPPGWTTVPLDGGISCGLRGSGVWK